MNTIHNHLSNVWSVWEEKLKSIGCEPKKKYSKWNIKMELNVIQYNWLDAGTIKRPLVGKLDIYAGSALCL